MGEPLRICWLKRGSLNGGITVSILKRNQAVIFSFAIDFNCFPMVTMNVCVHVSHLLSSYFILSCLRINSLISSVFCFKWRCRLNHWLCLKNIALHGLHHHLIVTKIMGNNSTVIKIRKVRPYLDNKS